MHDKITPKIINYSHIAQMAFNVPLLATAQLADTVTSFLQSKISGSAMDQIQSNQEMSAGEVTAIVLGNPANGQSLTVIPVHGILVPRRFAIEACAEMMSYELLRTQLTMALNDDSVNEIVLDINSGGGNAQGAFEIAEFIYQSRSIKPIRCVVNFNAFSGAYLIAAACSEIIVSETSGVGSIGVYTKRLDLTQHYQEQGVKIHSFYRGARKIDFHPDTELSEEERANIETNIESTYQKFINAVAKYRNITAEAVMATEADCFEGQQGIELGLADRMASPQDAINQISQAILTNNQPQRQQSISIQAAHLRMQSKL
ncbi:MAG: signal peptide peptidase SppA [Cognaticolwellia sp.]|jgi:signal peptide peptidase SppA